MIPFITWMFVLLGAIALTAAVTLELAGRDSVAKKMVLVMAFCCFGALVCLLIAVGQSIG